MIKFITNGVNYLTDWRRISRSLAGEWARRMKKKRKIGERWNKRNAKSDPALKINPRQFTRSQSVQCDGANFNILHGSKPVIKALAWTVLLDSAPNCFT